MTSIALLNRLHDQRRDLRKLIAPLVTHGADALDRHWWGRYRASRLERRSKALVLRAAVGDATMFNDASGPPSAENLQFAARLFQTHPSFAAAPFSYTENWADTIPSRLRALVPHVSPRDPTRFLAALFIRDAWALRTGGQLPLESAWHSVPTPLAARALSPLLDQRTLSRDDAARMGHYAKGRLPSVWAAWYFETGVRTLDARNLLVYTAVLLRGDRRGGRVQNRLPLSLAQAFTLAKRCVPEALAVLDIAQLALVRVIDASAIPADQDFLGLRQILGATTPPGFWDLPNELLAGMFVVATDGARQRVRDGMYDSGLLFNPARIAGLRAGHTARLARFAPYYAAVDTQALARSLAALGTADPAIASAIRRARRAAPELVDGIQLRGTHNILSVVLSAPTLHDGAELLPPVAHYAMGVSEPESTGTRPRRPDWKPPRTSAAAARYRRPLPPLFETLGLRT